MQHFTPLLIDAARPCRHAARPCRHAVGLRWFVDEPYVKVAGVWRYVYRAVDHHGQVIDVLVSKRHDIAAARAFFSTAVDAHGEPDEVIIDRADALAHVIGSGALQHRAVREQPSRVRLRTVERPATTDARRQDRPHRPRRHPRSRVRAVGRRLG
jgi:transposase-like protein